MIRQRHRIETAIALGAIAAALLVAACGGSSPSAKSRGVNIVRAAYVSSSVPGYQLAIKLSGSAAGQPISATGTGTFEQAAHAGRLAMNMSLGAEQFQINVVIIGGHFYVELPASLAGKIPGGKPWLELNPSNLGDGVGIQGLSSLAGNPGENPVQFLQFLRAASTGSVQNLGQQTIGGVSTTDLRATIDLSKVADTLPASEQHSASSAITSIEKLTGLHYLPIEAWVDSSDHVRRIVVSATGNVDGKPFSENVQLDFLQYGPEPVPAAPPADQVTNITP